MQNKMFIRAVLTLALGIMLTTTAYAEVENSMGLYFRLRQETWNNVFNFQNVDPVTGRTNNDDNFLRLKTSIWDRIEYDKKYGFYVKLTNEARYFFDSTNTSPGNRPLGMNKDEIFFDNLIVYANNIAGLPLDVSIGRQDLMYGDGFILMDGTPGDGSRSYYFNAAKTSVRFNESNSVDLIYITDQPYENSLPIMFSSPKRNLSAYHEEAAVVYGKLKPATGLGLEPYYVWKKEFGSDPNTLRLNTVGMRYTYTVGSSWRGLISRGEYAHQFGSYANGVKREADGGYIFAGQKYDTLPFTPSWELGYTYLSGTKPGATDINRGWDPLFSRYPWLSELYSLTLAKESGGILAYWSNLQAYRAAMKFVVTPDTTLDLSYTYMLANESMTQTSIFAAGGVKRGDLYIAKLAHKFTKAIDGYLLFEGFAPGGFYNVVNRDTATFVRWELQWKIQ
jgi:hypothetical protein